MRISGIFFNRAYVLGCHDCGLFSTSLPPCGETFLHNKLLGELAVKEIFAVWMRLAGRNFVI